MWRRIEGYKHPYRINEQGEVQRLDTKNGWVPVTAQMTWGRAYVHMIRADGVRVKIAVVRLMDDAFFAGRAKRDGLCIVHRNGCKADCSLENLVVMTQSEVGRLHGWRGGSRAVIRYDRNGETVVYRSVKEAARKNGMAPSTLKSRIHHGVLDPRGYRFEVER